MEPDTPKSGILQRLGIAGLTAIEAPIVAALATNSPLLLIGSHGTAKSLLLTRIAEALELKFRHYNASLLNFDDLVGFPLPSKDGSLEYVRTPAAIWGAGAVIFDEISRCRPDIQNKMFPIIHERKVQGISLDELQHRWAAMNPPALDDDDDNPYSGSEPLDAALADRFPYVVTMPSWDAFGQADQMAVIRAQGGPVAPADARAFAAIIKRTKDLLAAQPDTFAATAAEYTQTVVALLAQTGIVLSPRRANMLWRGVLAVNAASLALDANYNISDATWVALRVHLPQRAQGIEIPEAKVLLAHRESMRLAKLTKKNPLRSILRTSNPLERLRLATKNTLPKSEYSNVVADAIAMLQPGAREAAIVHVFETGAVGRLNAAVAAQTGEIYQDVAAPPTFSQTVHSNSAAFDTWSRIKDLLARLDPQQPRSHLHANAMASLFLRSAIQSPAAAEAAFAAFADADEVLRAS